MLEDRRPVRERASDELAEALRIAERAERDATTRDLVLVAGTDAALGRANRVLALLAESVDEHVVRKDHVRAVGDEQAPVELDAAALELVELGHEAARVDDHSLREHAGRLCAQDPARHEPDHELVVTDDEGVPRVRTTTEAHDHVGALGIDVDNLALAFVAPLRAHDHDGRHRSSSSRKTL